MLRKSALAILIAASAVLPACTHDEGGVTAFTPRAQDIGFFYLDEGPSAKLAYGEAQSDNVGLMLQCAKGSRLVEISDVARSAAAPTLTLISGGARSDLSAKVETGDGAIITAHAPMATPALTGFRKSGRMEVSYAGLRYGVTAKAHERAAVEQFFSACEKRSA